ncbi:transcription initiation factor TFIID subunit 5 [Aphelenchoides avenae]|nr:transcription initiation factor TFIID subunit 5 [Aphelenchus avenae]
MSDYRDLWREFRAVFGMTKKKLLKKPNYNEAIAQFRTLSQDMEDEEMPEHAALCHREIANIYEKTNNPLLRRTHLLKAAHLFHAGRMLRHGMHISVVSELGPLMKESYLRAIQTTVKQGYVRIAGVTYMEASHRLAQFHQYDDAFEYLLRASRFLQSDVYCQIAILHKLCYSALRMRNFEEALSDIFAVWTSLLKDQPFSATIRERLREVECKVVLLHLKHAVEKRDTQTPVLSAYDGHWRNLKSSVLRKEEFELLSDFIRLVREENRSEASSILGLRLSKYLDKPTYALGRQLIDSLNVHRPINNDLKKILVLDGVSDKEKRKMMFDLYSMLLALTVRSVAMLEEWLVRFLAFSLCMRYSLACNFIDTTANIQLTGEGFHSTLRLDTKISSAQRLINCNVAYYFRIPRGAYLDVDSLDSHLFNHCFVANHFDVEAAANSPKVPNFQSVVFHSNKVLRKVFLYEDSLAFPVHFRYHPPAEVGEGLTAKVQLAQPRVYLRCETNETFMAEPTCKKRIEKIPCGCSKLPKCGFFRLELKSQQPLEAVIPVASRDHSMFAGPVTIAVVFAGIVYVAVAMFRPVKNKKE